MFIKSTILVFLCKSNADVDCFIQLLSGGDLDIDVDDLRNNTRYTGGYSEGSRTIKLFWEVLPLTMEVEFRDFLKF